MTRSIISISLLAAVVFLGTAASSVDRGATDTLTIGAYSVVRDAFHEAILPAFARHWQRTTGRKVHFEESYSGSGPRPGRSPRASMPMWQFSPSRGTSTNWSPPASSARTGKPGRTGA